MKHSTAETTAISIVHVFVSFLQANPLSWLTSIQLHVLHSLFYFFCLGTFQFVGLPILMDPLQVSHYHFHKYKLGSTDLACSAKNCMSLLIAASSASWDSSTLSGSREKGARFWRKAGGGTGSTRLRRRFWILVSAGEGEECEGGGSEGGVKGEGVRGGGVVKGDGGWGEGDIVNTAKTYSKMVAHMHRLSLPIYTVSKHTHTPVLGLLSCGCDFDGSVFW